jgi:hypothetical protein
MQTGPECPCLAADLHDNRRQVTWSEPMATRLHRELMRSPLARTGVGCLSIFCLILTLVTGFAVWTRFLHARATANWAQATGTIDKVGIEETWSNGQTQYLPRVTYAFSHQGKPFIGNQLEPQEQTFSSNVAAGEAIAKLTGGAEVTVYYDPEDPTHSVLYPGAQRMDYLLLGLPLVLLFFAYGFLQMLQRSKAAGKSEATEEETAKE